MGERGEKSVWSVCDDRGHFENFRQREHGGEKAGADYRRSGNITVSGECNAKNGFGADAGFVRFSAFSDGDVSVEGKYDRFDTAWQMFCLCQSRASA